MRDRKTARRLCAARASCVCPVISTAAGGTRSVSARQRNARDARALLRRATRRHAARARTVDVHLAAQHGERVQVAPRHHLVSVADAEAELADSEHLRFGVASLVELAAHDVQVAADGLQVVLHLLCAARGRWA